MPKNILPPKTATILSTAETNRTRSATKEVFENIMLDTAEEKYLTQLGTDRGVTRPAAFFGDDDRWRAVVKALAFNIRHHREAVRRVVELVLAPYVSQVTVLDRKTNRNIVVGDTLQITSGANIGDYTIVGVTPHEVIFNAGTFATIPETGPISYNVGPGPTPPPPPVSPTVGFTSGVDGRLYVHQDGTERFQDTTQVFLNYARENILTTLNQTMPQYGTVIFDRFSPHEETVILAFYDNNESGLGKLKGTALQHTHTKTLPIQSSTLNARAETGDLTLTLRGSGGLNFPANAAGVPIVTTTLPDQLEIMEGPNVGSYAITVVNGDSVTVAGVLTVTGAHAQNRYKISPDATPAGSKGTILSRGGIVSNTGGLGPSIFRDPTTQFDALVDPYLPGPPVNHNYSVLINRGEANEETIEVISRNADVLTLILDPGDPVSARSLLKFDHEIGESVEVADLPTLATATYAPVTATTIVGVATGGTINQLDQATAAFPPDPASSYRNSDVEILTVAAGFTVPRFRTIDTVPLASGTRVTWVLALPAAIAAGDTYRIIKRYKAGIDNTLYVDDASGFPATNFTVILDRGRPSEEVVYIATNTAPPVAAATGFPWTLVLSNPAVIANDHEMDMTVELAQVLVQGCDWEIIETRATGEFTLLVDPDCVPELEVNDATYLHPLIPNLAAGTTAALTAAVTVGDDFIEMSLGMANSYLTAIETVEDLRQGEIFRPIVIDAGGVDEEFAFATRQRRFTKFANDFSIDGPAQSFIEVDDATSFVGLLVGHTVGMSRNSTHPNSGLEGLGFVSVDLTTTPHRINLGAPLAQSHHIGDTVEIDPVELSTSTTLNTNALPVNVELLYTVEDVGTPRYKHIDPYDITSHIEVLDGDIRSSVGESYFADSGQFSSDGIAGKPIYPGSYLLGLIDEFGTTIDQPTGVITRLAAGADPNNLDAMFRIPFQQAITSAISANPLGGGSFTVDDVSLYPADIQNPFFVLIDKGNEIEERLEIGSKVGTTLNIDITQVTKYAHAIGATIDLEISKLLLISSAGLPDTGGIYFDYGFRGNSEHIEVVQLNHTADLAGVIELTDFSADFHNLSCNAIADYPNILVGDKVLIRPGGPNEEIGEVLNVPFPNTIRLVAPLVVPIAIGENFRVYATLREDDQENGILTQKVGGVCSPIGAMDNNPPTIGIEHPARTGGVVEEYTRYVSRANNVITLNKPHIFDFAHPAETEIIIGSNQYAPQGDGSDYPPYLVGNYLEAVFNSEISTLPDLMRAVGIELKVEVKDA